MGRSQKTKRVSWALDVNLCQVRLFLSEESPSRVVLDTQDHLQGKASLPLQSGDDSDDNLPPGFEGIQPANPWRFKLSQIPLIKWGHPLRFGVNIEWQVGAGEESKEVEAQNQRETRVLEAVYPRPSSIPFPSNPSGLVNVENPIAFDKNTPVVPVTPIEDDRAVIPVGYTRVRPGSDSVFVYSTRFRVCEPVEFGRHFVFGFLFGSSRVNSTTSLMVRQDGSGSFLLSSTAIANCCRNWSSRAGVVGIGAGVAEQIR
ncbi:hypothetical protein OROGR_026364 [Orobanche gracilis]